MVGVLLQKILEIIKSVDALMLILIQKIVYLMKKKALTNLE
jgi:hypothetical protein